MHNGICLLSAVPIRKEHAHRSEMVSQLLFGEIVHILNSHESWLFVRCLLDNYEGWVDQKQISIIAGDITFNREETAITTAMTDKVINSTAGTTISICAGSSLPGFRDGKFTVNNEHFLFNGSCEIPLSPVNRDKLFETAVQFLNTPYFWGGRSTFGIDCSGFVQVVCKISGIFLPRDAAEQAAQGELLGFVDEAAIGDLAFFDNEQGEITHTGILLGGGKIIHASGSVRIDSIDHHGIFNESAQSYSHKLRLVKRIMPA